MFKVFYNKKSTGPNELKMQNTYKESLLNRTDVFEGIPNLVQKLYNMYTIYQFDGELMQYKHDNELINVFQSLIGKFQTSLWCSAALRFTTLIR